MSIKQLSWEQFSTKSQNDGSSVNARFEDLCRQIFINYISHGNPAEKLSLLQYSANNPGLETEPVLNEKDGRYYGFQAKYFTSKFSYEQVGNSLAKAKEKYSGKVDVILLFTNKEINLNSKSFSKLENELKDADIELRVISNRQIFDYVREDDSLSTYYFGNHTISDSWIKQHNKAIISILGQRFNQEFNIDTNTESETSFFCKDSSAIDNINKMKTFFLEKLKSLEWDMQRRYSVKLQELRETISELPDITYSNIENAFTWHDTVTRSASVFLAELNTRLEEIKRLMELPSEQNKTSGFSRNSLLDEYWGICRIIKIVDDFQFSAHLQNLIKNKIMLIHGEPGIGKTHTIANQISKLQAEGRTSVFFLADAFTNDSPITKQMMEQYETGVDFSEFLNILEIKAENKHSEIIIFIDALNETKYFRLWKRYLPDIIISIDRLRCLKLVISCRTDYLQDVIPDSVMQNEHICKIEHTGFANKTIEAARKYFEYKQIPFTLYDYSTLYISNPLLLKLYCDTYDGNEVSLINLYEKLCLHINDNLHNKSQYPLKYKTDIVTPFALAISAWFVHHHSRQIGIKEIMTLPYWNEYGIQDKQYFLNYLCIEGLLNHKHIAHGEDTYSFLYDQMNDYFYAKAFSDTWKNKREAKKTIRETLYSSYLFNHQRNVNPLTLMYISEFYNKKYHEECIDLMINMEQKENRKHIIDAYINSLNWRRSGDISIVHFQSFIKKHNPSKDAILNLLINSSLKPNNPLNADYLHSILFKMPLAHRDRDWTSKINEYFNYPELQKAVDMIRSYINGDNSAKICGKNHEELTITLFVWFLSSSNIKLRDDTTFAITELLKTNFSACLSVLRKFEDVNDSYIMQRLYAAVFAACCKNPDKTKEKYQQLAEYIYSTIFNQDEVYPDILVRDYARLIIELFLHENPAYSGKIKKGEIAPPYKSKPLPIMESSPYFDESHKTELTDSNWGSRKIISSMRLEEFIYYGDFGRYVFEQNLNHFDVNKRSMFYLALSIIFEDLGYNDMLFSEIDHKTISGIPIYRKEHIERIGKKYEWIAFYNILARVSDQCTMIDRFSRTTGKFDGPWEILARQFDPTLLPVSFIKKEQAPAFPSQDGLRKDIIKEILSLEERPQEWIDSSGILIDRLPQLILQKDSESIEWLYLDALFVTRTKDRFEDEKLTMWTMLRSFFVTEEQESKLMEMAKMEQDIWTYEMNQTAHSNIYSREYPWSPSCKKINEEILIEPEWYYENGCSTQVQHTILTEHEREVLEELCKYSDNPAYSCASIDSLFNLIDTKLSKEEKSHIIEYIALNSPTQEKEDNIVSVGAIQQTCTSFEPISYGIISKTILAPNPELISFLGLRQLDIDFVYYDDTGKIAAFDIGFLTEEDSKGLIIRKDLIDKYIAAKHIRLIWCMQSEKQYTNEYFGPVKYKTWEGFYSYNNNGIKDYYYKLEGK